MKKYILLSFILLFSLLNISFSYGACEQEDINYKNTYKKLTELEESKHQIYLLLEQKRKELDNAKRKIRNEHPSASYSYAKSLLNKNYYGLINSIDKLTLKWKSQQHEFNLLNSNLRYYANKYNECAEKENQKSFNIVKNYVNNGNKAFNDGDYYKAIELYKKAKKLSGSKTIRENLSKAYFLYANGRLFKDDEENAIKYYELALNEGYGNKFNIFLNIGLAYDSMSLEKQDDIKLLNKALLYYNRALNSTSKLKEIEKIEKLIKETKNRIKAKEEIKNKKEEKKVEIIKKEDKKEKNIKTNTIQYKKLEAKAKKILDRINLKTKNYSFEYKVKLYNKYISILTNYSNKKAKGDLKVVIDLIIEGLKKEINNNFEESIENLLGL